MGASDPDYNPYRADGSLKLGAQWYICKQENAAAWKSMTDFKGAIARNKADWAKMWSRK